MKICVSFIRNRRHKHLTSTGDVIIADIGQVCLLVFSLDGVTLGVDHLVLSDNYVIRTQANQNGVTVFCCCNKN